MPARAASRSFLRRKPISCRGGSDGAGASGGRQRADSHGDPRIPTRGAAITSTLHAHEHRSGHRAWADIRAELDRSGLDADVKKHAVAIFELLAEAEAKVHGVEVDSVTFHEVGAVDSIVDIVAAAQLISLIRADRWTSAPLPIGSGRINTAHGVLPIPAPAAALLLQGLPVIDDGVPGERVTPTGAALARLSHRAQARRSGGRICRLSRSGVGFGARTLPGISNCLRALAFDEATAGGAFDGRRPYRSPAIGGHHIRGRRPMPGGFGGRTRPYPCVARSFRRDPEFRCR